MLSLGGTKNGALAAEAVVVVDPELAADPALGLVYVRKLTMQLASKMRFVSAQLLALYGDDLWLRSAGHANAMAARLAAGVQGLAGGRITQAVQANAVFAVLDRGVADALRESFRFYDWNPATRRGAVDVLVGHDRGRRRRLRRRAHPAAGRLSRPDGIPRR